MARVSKRVGFGVNEGAINSKITQGPVKPISGVSKDGDLHINFSKGEISQYDGTNWTDLRMIYVGATAPDNVNWLWYDTVNFTLKYYSGGTWN